MNGKRGKKRSAVLQQGIWATGQVQKTLDENGVVLVRGENPEFAGAPPYYVYLGLRVGKSGPVHWEIPHFKEGDHFYAEVQKSGSFDIHLAAQSLSNQDVTIVWWASSHGRAQGWFPPIPTAGPTGGPTPTPPPPPTVPPIGLMIMRFKARDFPGRYVDELPGIDPESIQRLTQARMKNLAVLASADATRVARILNCSEVRAMGLIYEARLLLQGKMMR